MSYWHLDLANVFMSITLAAFYLFLSGGKLQKGWALFFAGLSFMLLTESSPLHFLGMHYLFSAHMVVHIILLLICAPLLVLGLPLKIAPQDKNYLYAVTLFLNHYPWVSWIAGISIMWFWHIPAVFDAAFPAMHTSFSLLPILHTSSLLFAGVLFYWPLIGPFPVYRVTPPLGVVYLFTACIGCSLLGLLLTFSPLGIYHHYMQTDQMGFISVIRNQWGISAQNDQQMAGLIMWVPCCFIYLSGSVYLLKKWLTEKDENEPLISRTGTDQIKIS